MLCFNFLERGEVKGLIRPVGQQGIFVRHNGAVLSASRRRTAAKGRCYASCRRRCCCSRSGARETRSGRQKTRGSTNGLKSTKTTDNSFRCQCKHAQCQYPQRVEAHRFSSRCVVFPSRSLPIFCFHIILWSGRSVAVVTATSAIIIL